jgi:hypothetical protein
LKRQQAGERPAAPAAADKYKHVLSWLAAAIVLTYVSRPGTWLLFASIHVLPITAVVEFSNTQHVAMWVGRHMSFLKAADATIMPSRLDTLAA